MLFVVLASMVALAMGFVLLALFRPLPRSLDTGREARKVALQAQLREAERDLADRKLTPHEHELAEAEIARNLFRLEDEPAMRSGGTSWRRPILWGAAASVPAVAIASYLALGAPGLSAQPHSQREDLRALLSRAEARLRRAPDDLRGWAAVAPVYTRLGRSEEAAAAYERALSAERLPPRVRSAMLAEWAEAASLGAGAPVAATKARLDEAIALDSNNAKARFLLAMASEETNPPERAAADWRALLERFPGATDRWTDVARARLARLEVATTIPVAERADRIEGMVAGLASRLEAEPDDLDGWLRLVRSYAVLGRANAARDALDRARSQFAGKPTPLARLTEGARQSGIAVE